MTTLIGQRLQQERLKKGLTREMLAAKVQTEDKLQLTYRILDLMERKDYFPPTDGEKIIAAIARHLGIEADLFIYINEAA